MRPACRKRCAGRASYPRAGRHRGGFTLPEVLVAIAVLAVALLFASSFLVTFIRSSALTERTAVAAALAQDKVEELLQALPSTVAGGQDSTSSYTRVWTISTNTGFRRVTVQVGWRDVSGAQRSFSMSGAVAR